MYIYKHIYVYIYTKVFKHCDYKFKIGATRKLLSENTFAGQGIVIQSEQTEQYSNISNEQHHLEAAFNIRGATLNLRGRFILIAHSRESVVGLICRLTFQLSGMCHHYDT